MQAMDQTRIKDFECKLLRKDGSTFDAELNAASVKDAVGKFNGFVTSVRDITERKSSTMYIQAHYSIKPLYFNVQM